jgi:hypothetical protein
LEGGREMERDALGGLEWVKVLGEKLDRRDGKKQMVLSARGGNKLEYEMVAKERRGLFEGVGEDKDDWGKNGRRGWGNQNDGSDGKNQEGWRKRTRGGSGRITKCGIWGPEYHWAGECIRNYKNNRESKSKHGREEDWREIEAILFAGGGGTGCGEGSLAGVVMVREYGESHWKRGIGRGVEGKKVWIGQVWGKGLVASLRGRSEMS